MGLEIILGIVGMVIGVPSVLVAIHDLRQRRGKSKIPDPSLPAAGDISRREAIIERGVVVVGVTKHNAIFCDWSLDASGNVEAHGLYPEIVRIFAAAHGLSVEFRGIKWSELEHAFTRHGCDLVVHVLETERRRETGDFTFRRYEMSLCGVVRAEEIRTLVKSDLTSPDIRISVNRGEAAFEYVTEHLGIHSDRCLLVDQADLRTMMDLVRAGMADVGICDSVSCADYVDEHPEMQMIWRHDPVEWRKNSVFVPPGDKDFGRWVDQGFRSALDSPVVREMEQRALATYPGLVRVY